MLAEHNNVITQPLSKYRIFNRWDIITNGWYFIMPAKDLNNGEVKSLNINGQHLVVFRTQDGELAALDGYCPHMGVDLGLGKVNGDSIQCFFHHWSFDKKGQCIDIPCLSGKNNEHSKKVKNRSYIVAQKYGALWVNPDSDPKNEVLEIPELEGCEVRSQIGKAYERSCHFHITMINGIDPQHLKTVHDINIAMDVQIEQAKKDTIKIELSGKTPDKKISEKLVKFILGDNYAYSMAYQGGCLAGLSLMKNVKLFNRWNVLPTLHMFFAYQSPKEGISKVVPIYVTRKRSGIFGALLDHLFLGMTKIAFLSLQGEDGKVYENIRFNSRNLLPIDQPVAQYIKYINSLTKSCWSKSESDVE